MLKCVVIVLLTWVTSNADATESKWLTQDFKVIHVDAPNRVAEFSSLNVESCREQIVSAICLVDPAKTSDNTRRCLPTTVNYAKYFQDLYDVYPPHLQKMLCHLKRIYIEKKFFGSAYAGLFTEGSDDHLLGGLIGIRQAMLDHTSTLDEWASWKEQIHFGTSASQVNVAAGLPTVQTSMHNGQLDMLYFLVAHELGHVFDFTNNLNDFTGCETHASKCVLTPKPNTWGALSWKTFDVPLVQDSFALRPSLCFYFCNGKFIAANRQDELYTSLARTNFLSAYTTRYPTEDFADTFAFYTLMTERKGSYVVTTASGKQYDIVERLRTDPLMAAKKQYLEDFLNSRYKYPGDE